MSTIEKKSLLSVGFIFLGTLLVLTIANSTPENNPYLYYMIGIIWFILIFIREIKTKKQVLSKDWRLFKEKKWHNILYIILTVIVLYTVIQLAHPFFNQFVPEKKPNQYLLPTGTFVGLLFGVFVGITNLVVAFVEEITYRYEGMYVFKSNKLLLVLFLIISSILFGFSHYYNFGGSFLATGPYIFAGLVLGVVYLISSNIWIPLIAHMIFNSTSIFSNLLLIGATLITNR